MAEIKDQCIESNRIAKITCLVELFILGITKFQLQFRHIIALDRANGSIRSDPVKHRIFGCIFATVTDDSPISQTIIMFVVVGQFSLPQISGPRIFLAFPGQEHIILAGIHVLLSQLVDIVHIFQADRVQRKFLTVFFTIIERILDKSIIFQLFIFCSIRHISVKKQVPAKCRRCCSSHTETGSFDCIATDCRVHGPELKFTFQRVLIRRDIAGHED